jgi:transposase
MEEIDMRKARGRALAQIHRLVAKRGLWIVPSATHGGSYFIDPKEETCTCADYATITADKGGSMGRRCKHLWAYLYARGRVHDGEAVAFEIMKPKYNTTNWIAYNEASTREGEMFQKLLSDLCAGIEQPPQEKGRDRLLLADVVYAAALKVFLGSSGRRTMSAIRQAEALGHVEKAPHYNSISRYLEDESILPVLKGLVEQSALPLRGVESKFAVDATGFGTNQYARWFDKKYKKEKKRARWVKLHAFIGVQTCIIVTCEVTEGEQHDCPMLTGLVDRASARQWSMEEVLGDKGYLDRKSYVAIEKAGAVPYLHFRDNCTAKRRDPAIWTRLLLIFQADRETYEKHYHLRSNVESVFSSMKAVLGPAVRAKTPVSQYAEVFLKCLVHNIRMIIHAMIEFGITAKFWPTAA